MVNQHILMKLDTISKSCIPRDHMTVDAFSSSFDLWNRIHLNGTAASARKAAHGTFPYIHIASKSIVLFNSLRPLQNHRKQHRKILLSVKERLRDTASFLQFSKLFLSLSLSLLIPEQTSLPVFKMHSPF